MSLSQVQIIRSLAEPLAWFGKELAWEVAPAELRHLSGRIGELYAAMITRGQMALAVNQKGYDVVSAEGRAHLGQDRDDVLPRPLKKGTLGDLDQRMMSTAWLLEATAPCSTRR